MNVQENNKLIAVFNGDIKKITDKVSFNKSCSVDDLQYHKDWNWLMEVVQKIEDLGNDVAITSNYVQIAYNDGEDFISIELKGRIMLGAVYNACVEFIKWYNEQK